MPSVLSNLADFLRRETRNTKHLQDPPPAALTATVIRYRSRGAVREVGKAMGLPEDVTAALAGYLGVER